jgi:malate dehydrogenase (oxaloacetate-decarboxylating)(NADP+)
LGLKQHRERGPEYDSLIDELMQAAMDKFGSDVLIQFEDFGNLNAFRLLNQWNDKACCFNDDIQGTAAVALGGLLASEKLTRKKLSDHTFLFSGAGEAGTGIAQLIAYAISLELDVPIENAREKIFLVDSKGLITKHRGENIEHHKKDFAHDIGECNDLKSAIDLIKPTAIIGVSAMSGTFDQEVCEKMAQHSDHPIIAALSNPTSKAECTAEQAYKWTDGKAIFCSGSPFGPVTLDDGRHFIPGQGNNAYIFPGIGLGHLAARMTRITNDDMYIAAKALSEQVTQEDLDAGCLYPPLYKIRDVSAHIAVAIANHAHETGVATEIAPSNMMAHVKSLMYDPFEDPYVNV